MRCCNKFHILPLFILLLLLGAAPAMAVYQEQCPPDTDGIDTDGDSVVDNDHVCIHLGAGDGYAVMADGYPQYIFSFSEYAGLHSPGDAVPKPSHVGNMWNDTPPGAMLAAAFPAPTIELREGQKLYLTLSNVGMMMRPDLFDPHTVHWHGFPQAASIFDGVPSLSLSINMGASLTYFYDVVEPGTFMYHCHVEATEHMQMGMLGNLYVRPKQDFGDPGNGIPPAEHGGGAATEPLGYAYNDGDGSTAYDVEYPIQIHSFDPDFHDASHETQPLPFALMDDRYPMLNGRGYPDTVNPANLTNELGFEAQTLPSLIEADQGQRILLRISSLATVDYYTLRTLGIPMTVVGQGSRLLRGPSGEDLSYTTNALTLGGGQAMDVILDTAAVDPGTYFLYTTNLNNLNNNEEDYGGMMTEIVISP